MADELSVMLQGLPLEANTQPGDSNCLVLAEDHNAEEERRWNEIQEQHGTSFISLTAAVVNTLRDMRMSNHVAKKLQRKVVEFVKDAVPTRVFKYGGRAFCTAPTFWFIGSEDVLALVVRTRLSVRDSKTIYKGYLVEIARSVQQEWGHSARRRATA
jgi:hypothetical protein